MVSNFYDVLLVDQNATLDEIKVAFKRRALQVHPDKGGSKEGISYGVPSTWDFDWSNNSQEVWS